MLNLDNLNAIKRLDKTNMLGSIDLLHKQVGQTWNDIQEFEVPDNYKNVKKVIINGMGGSGIGGHIVRTLFSDKIKIPVMQINSYKIPECLDRNTLYIVSSYSGTTEEPLTEIGKAVKKKAKVIGITTGGKQKIIFDKYELPYFNFEPLYNPCDQPRMGLGYSIFGQVGIFERCGLIDIKDKQVEEVRKVLRASVNRFGSKISIKTNIAKQTAKKLCGKIPIIIASEFLEGNAHTMANQINENAKNFAAYHLISELNHHLMEGLKHPKSNSKNLFFLFINSDLYYSRNQKRYSITQDVVEKNKVGWTEFKPKSKTKLLQAFEVLSFGSYVGFYLAMLNGLNPAPIPYVDYFKERLS
ncbi:hypothetical protein JW977_00135 [Candidatus Falkowbacteria bacterium]|nr:hypothetical protein [Candidatus Falkowbacteria bacterium]